MIISLYRWNRLCSMWHAQTYLRGASCRAVSEPASDINILLIVWADVSRAMKHSQPWASGNLTVIIANQWPSGPGYWKQRIITRADRPLLLIRRLAGQMAYYSGHEVSGMGLTITFLVRFHSLALVLMLQSPVRFTKIGPLALFLLFDDMLLSP